MTEPYRGTLRLSYCAHAQDRKGGRGGNCTLSACSSLLWISLSHSSRQEVDNMEQRTKKLHNGSILGMLITLKEKGISMATGIS